MKLNYPKIAISFCILYIIALVVFFTRTEQYERPLSFFVLVGLLAVILSLLVFHTPRDRNHIIGTFSLIVLFIITIQWSQVFVYPTMIGTDPIYHHTLTHRVMNDITIRPVEYYGTLVFHLIIGNLPKYTGLSEQWASMVAVGLPYSIVISWVIYKIGSLIYTYRAGLLAVLALSMASFFIYFGIETIPSTYGIMMVMIVIYLAVKISMSKNWKHNLARYCSIACLSVLIILTNALMAIFCVVVLALLWVGFLIYHKITKHIYLNYNVFLYICTAYGVAVILWGLFGSGQFAILLRMIGNDELTRAVTDIMNISEGWKVAMIKLSYFQGEMPDANYWTDAFTSLSQNYVSVIDKVMEYQSSIPLYEVVVKRVGLIVYGMLSIAGIYSCIKKYKTLRSIAFVWAFIAIVIGISLAVNISLSRYFFISRHILLAQIIFSPMVAMGLIFIMDHLRNRQIIGSAIMGILAFVAIISPYSNIDNRDLDANSVVRLAFTNEELRAIDDICSMTKADIATDWFTGYYIYHLKKQNQGWTFRKCYDMAENIVNSDYSNIPVVDIVMLRSEINNYPTLIADRFYKPAHDQDAVLISQGFIKVYDNGVVRGYRR